MTSCSQPRVWAPRQPRQPIPHVEPGRPQGDAGRSLILAASYPSGRGSRPLSLFKATPDPGIPPGIPQHSSYRGLQVPVPRCIRDPLPGARPVLPEIRSREQPRFSPPAVRRLVEGPPPAPRDGAWEMVASLGHHSPGSREDWVQKRTGSRSREDFFLFPALAAKVG